MSSDGEFSPEPMKFESVLQANVPKGRDGKHKEIVTQLLSDIERLSPGTALKIPLSQLPDTKQNVRSALSRAGVIPQPSSATAKEIELRVYSTVTRMPRQFACCIALRTASRAISTSC